MDADLVACRPDSEDGLLLAAQLVIHPPGPGRTRPYDGTPAPCWMPPQPGPETNLYCGS